MRFTLLFILCASSSLLLANEGIDVIGKVAGAEAAPNEAPANLPVILLRNGQVLEGAAKQEGDRIVIEQADGSKLRMAIGRVLCWGPNLRSLYQYRVDHRGRPNLQDHLEEANWCLNNRLLREAALELLHAREFSPRHREVLRLGKRLEQATAPVRQVAATSEATEKDESEMGQFVSLAATQQFTRTVQPILLNRCGTCHDASRKLEFKLQRLSGTTRVSAEMTRTNLQRTLIWIDIENPTASKLLQFAQNPHGTMKTPPLGKSQAKAIQSLIAWLAALSQNHSVTPISNQQDATASRLQTKMPTSRSVNPFDNSPAGRMLRQAASPSGTSALNNDPTGQPTQDRTGDLPGGSNPANRSTSSSKLPNRATNTTPKRLPTVKDPFDPEVFNRLHHAQD